MSTRPPKTGSQLHVARGAPVERRVVVSQAAQRLDDGGLRGAAGVAARQIGEETRQRSRELGDQGLEPELADERGGARDGVRALRLQDAAQLGARRLGIGALAHPAQSHERLFERPPARGFRRFHARQAARAATARGIIAGL